MAKILVFPDGSEIPVVEDGGRYWITANAKYSKSNKDITVKRVPDAPQKGNTESKRKADKNEKKDGESEK